VITVPVFPSSRHGVMAMQPMQIPACWSVWICRGIRYSWTASRQLQARDEDGRTWRFDETRQAWMRVIDREKVA